ncbi:MAG: NAD(P)/FAD-dependent oxidoreductase [Cypionkella sp.]
MYPATFYAQTRSDLAERPELQGPHDTDTVIVGGGLAGLTTALELARAGIPVIVLESQSIGYGASGRNGGIVSPAFACGSDAIAAKVGPEKARALHRLTLEGVDRLRSNIETLGITDAQATPGLLNLRRFDASADLHAHAEDFARDYGYTFTYLNREAIQARLATTRYLHGLEDTQAFHIHPLNYLRALAREIERLGGQIHENSPAIGTHFGAAKTIRTPNGSVTAPRAIFATGGYTGPLIPRLKRAVLPIATYMMQTEAAPDLLAATIKTKAAVLDDRRASDYYRLVDGGNRLLWGGRITTRAASAEGVARELRTAMLDVYPQLAPLKTEVAWSGLMAYARHLMPQIGRLQPDVWHITAFGGHGLNTTAIAGKVLAEAILDETNRIDLFAPWGLANAFGPLGLAAAQLTYWGLQAQDLWRERKT